MKWVWECRECKKQYPESGEGCNEGTNPSGLPLKICTCNGIVDLRIVLDESSELDFIIKEVSVITGVPAKYFGNPVKYFKYPIE